ncbi:hypothetical protein F5X96DRAFT_615645 [Biscogniauxia mediterranea]|nr:hypothetical protein F5X96DRAFT_615645 [Biscogniauxia mediterranea]
MGATFIAWHACILVESLPEPPLHAARLFFPYTKSRTTPPSPPNSPTDVEFDACSLQPLDRLVACRRLYRGRTTVPYVRHGTTYYYELVGPPSVHLPTASAALSLPEPGCVLDWSTSSNSALTLTAWLLLLLLQLRQEQRPWEFCLLHYPS